MIFGSWTYEPFARGSSLSKDSLAVKSRATLSLAALIHLSLQLTSAFFGVFCILDFGFSGDELIGTIVTCYRDSNRWFSHVWPYQHEICLLDIGQERFQHTHEVDEPSSPGRLDYLVLASAYRCLVIFDLVGEGIDRNARAEVRSQFLGSSA